MKTIFRLSTLTGKFTAFLFVMSLVPILVLGYVSYSTTAKTLVEQELIHTNSLIIAQEKVLDVILREIEGLIHNISGIEILIDAMDKKSTDLSTFERLAAQAQIGYILNGYLGLEGLVSIDVISEYGIHFHVGQTLAQSGINQSLLDDLKATATASRNRIVWAGATRPINLSINNDYVLTAAKVIRKADLSANASRLVGTIVISYDLDNIHKTLSAASFEGLGLSMLLDQRQRIIFQQDKLHLGEPVEQAYQVALDSFDETFKVVYEGLPYFVASKELTFYGWTLLRIIPEKDLLTRTQTIRLTTGASVAFGLSILIIGFFYLNRRIVNPIGNLVQKFQKINSGEFNLSDQMPEEGNDEITELTRWFNLTVATLIDRESYAIALKESETRHELILKASHEGIWDWNLANNVITLSADFAQLMGLNPDTQGKIHTAKWMSRIHPLDREGFNKQVTDYLNGETDKFIFEYRIQTGLGEYRWILSHGIGVKDETGKYILMAGSHTDINSRKEAEEQLTHDAFHDKLTGLYNRAFLVSYLTQLFAAEKREHTTNFALMFLDLDGFKSVNDSMGHAAGDRLLKETSERLKHCLREADVLTRFGGDEFVILLTNIEQFRYAQVAQRIIASLNEPYAIMGQEHRVGASIGVTLSSNGYASPEDMMRDADLAMYRAKAAGKNCYVLFDHSMRQEMLRTIRLEQDIQHALDRHEFQLYYQSIVDTHTKELLQIECFARWNHPDKGLLDAIEFIEYAEQKDLIKDIGYWALDTALTQYAAWSRNLQGKDVKLEIAVNFSIKQLFDTHLLTFLIEKLDALDLPASALIIDVKASVIAQDSSRAKQALRMLKDKGCLIHLDDFGMDYSSLSYLIDYPVDALKIEQSLLDIDDNPEQRTKVISGIIQFAEALGIRCIAEGVETNDQLALLRSVGCHSVQGYLIDKPVNADEYYQTVIKNI